MTGETDLATLLRTMQPVLREGEYVFCTVDFHYPDCGYQFLDALAPIGLFQEAEGLTLILPRQRAEAAGLPYTAIFSLITLTVHSSLEAVGFLAAITTLLAQHQISVNPVSAYYHDHLLIPLAQADHTMRLLQRLTQTSDDSPS